MGFGHGQPYRVAGLLDLIGDETFGELADVRDAVEPARSPRAPGGRPFDDAAGHVNAPVGMRRKRAAFFRFDLDCKAGEVLPGEGRIGERLPSFRASRRCR